MVYFFLFLFQIFFSIFIYFLLKKKLLQQIEIEKIEKVVDTLILHFKKKADEKLDEMKDNILFFEELSKKIIFQIKTNTSPQLFKKLQKEIKQEKVSNSVKNSTTNPNTKSNPEKNIKKNQVDETIQQKEQFKKDEKKIEQVLSDEIDLKKIMAFETKIKTEQKPKESNQRHNNENLLEEKIKNNFKKLSLEQKIFYLYNNGKKNKEIASQLKLTVSEVDLYLKKLL